MGDSDTPVSARSCIASSVAARESTPEEAIALAAEKVQIRGVIAEPEVLSAAPPEGWIATSEFLAPIESLVSTCRADLKLAKRLWDLAGVVTNTIGEWEGTLWKSVNTGLMDEEIKQMAKTMCLKLQKFGLTSSIAPD